MTKLLDQLAKEQSVHYEAKQAEKAKRHAEEQRQSELYLVRNELLNAENDLEALKPSLDQADELRKQIAELRKRKRELVDDLTASSVMRGERGCASALSGARPTEGGGSARVRGRRPSPHERHVSAKRAETGI